MDRAEADTFMNHLPAERFEAVLRSISDGVFTVDTRGRITCFNRAAEAITGYNREEALGKPCHTIFRSDICEEACALRYTLETGQPIVDLAVSVLSREGKEIPLSISTALFRDRDGSVMGGVETFRDLRQVETLRFGERGSRGFPPEPSGLFWTLITPGMSGSWRTPWSTLTFSLREASSGMNPFQSPCGAFRSPVPWKG